MKKARNGFIKTLPYLCLVGVIAIGLMTIVGTGGGGGDGSEPLPPGPDGPLPPVAGGWTGSAGFGELSFIVNSASTEITEISYAFSDFLCGIATHNETRTVKPTTPWSITDSQFTIERTFDPNFEMTLIGTFDETGKNASGTWEAVSYGTTCSGTWDASPVGGGGGSEADIEWIFTQTVITYKYSQGFLVAMVFNQKFGVTAGSGDVPITATLKEASGNYNMLDEQTETFYVEEGNEYEMQVHVNVRVGWGCSPFDKDVMIFSSPSALTTSETTITPLADINPVTGQPDWCCVRQYEIDTITLN